MTAIASVTSCASTACAFNSNGCAAFAVTVTGVDGAARCGTFIDLDARGGLPTASGQVGACQLLECVHNTDLMCTAEGIAMDAVTDGAQCRSYAQA